jgi:hypothetical protein
MPLESQSHIHLITVQVPSPTLTVTANPSDTVNVGSSVILKCECIWNAGIAVSFSWDTPIESPSSYADMAQSGNRLTLVANTTISHVEKTDEGKYSCTVGPDNNLMPYVLGPTVNTSVFLRVLGEGIIYTVGYNTVGFSTKSSMPKSKDIATVDNLSCMHNYAKPYIVCIYMYM